MAQVRELLEQVKARIMADPGTYDQGTFCGTACCIAGHIDIIINGEEVHARRASSDFMQIESVALSAIGENGDIWLFAEPTTHSCDECDEDDEDDERDSTRWPHGLSVEYEYAETPLARAAVGCKAIDRYLAERGL